VRAVGSNLGNPAVLGGLRALTKRAETGLVGVAKKRKMGRLLGSSHREFAV
jgi:hypothetical protein